MFKVIIAGSRDFTDYELLSRKLDHILSLKSDIVIISGMARGTDLLAVKYASERGLKVMKFPADWDKHGKKAGYIRNIEMLKCCDAVVCFRIGQSLGTSHMIEIANEYRKPLRIIQLPGI
jgi:hypothetical protein